MSGALSRFRMLDLTRQLPGPFCSTLLADLGMDVLAICAPTDPMGMGIPLLGRNKRSLTLNLKRPDGQAIFHRLVQDADVVLEGGRPGGAAKLRADYDTLREVNPRLVYCSISGYGQDGPYRDRVGHDVNYLGFAGVIGLTGEAGGAPVIPGVQIADPQACQCGEVLKGALKPQQCRVFGTACTPETPVGALMVSSEGACAAYYRYAAKAA